MNKLIAGLKKGIIFLISEFFGQIIAAVILIVAYVSWVYFSSGYAAIIVIVIGILVWIFISKLVIGNKNKQNN
jgi:Flp pilus assembly protein TadB